MPTKLVDVVQLWYIVFNLSANRSSAFAKDKKCGVICSKDSQKLSLNLDQSTGQTLDKV